MRKPNNLPDWNSIAASVRDVCFHRWGGPRSPLALGYLEQTMLPDILWFLHRLEPWWHTDLTRELLKDKFVIQHGFPAVLGQGMAEEILAEIQNYQSIHSEEKELLFLLLAPIAMDQPMHYLTETFPLPEEIWARFKMAWRQQYNFLAPWQFLIDSFIESWQKDREFRLNWQFRTEIWLTGVNYEWDHYLLQLIQLEKYRLGLLGQLNSNDIDSMSLRAWVHPDGEGQLKLNQTGSKVITPWILDDIIDTVEDRLMLGGPTHGINSALAILTKLYPAQVKLLLDVIVEKKRFGWLPLLENWYERAEKSIKLVIIPGIGNLGQRNSLPFLISILQSDDPSLILTTCDVLAQIGDQSCGFALINLLKNSSYIVQEKIILTLTQLKFMPAVKVLQKMLEDPLLSLDLKRTIKNAIKTLNNSPSSI